MINSSNSVYRFISIFLQKNFVLCILLIFTYLFKLSFGLTGLLQYSNMNLFLPDNYLQ